MGRLVLSQITIKKERSISSTTWYYLLQPSNASAPDSTNYGNPPPIYSDTGYNGWSTTEPTYTVGDDRVLYTMVQTLYSDNTFSYSIPTISSSYEAAKDAYNEVVQAEQDILELQELGLASGYIWDNMTYVAPTSTIPVYPIGSYIASGTLVNGSRTITHANSNTYGLNTWISTGGINLRYNAIDLMKLTTSNLEFYYPSTSSQGVKAISLGTNGAINSLVFYGFNNSNKTMELTNNALNFYNPTDGSTLLSSLTSDGLILSKGGIVVGSYNSSATDSNQNFVYLSSEDYGTGIQIGNSSSGKADWRQIIGNKFGVDKAGNLYASNANIEGDIVASSLTISSGGSTYNGVAAINISGYSIEITSEERTLNVSTYLTPHLYHNGIEVTSGLTYTHFVWYQDDDTIGTAGDSTDGGYLATYGHKYRVVYDFEDGEVGGGTTIQTREIDPSKYITKIDDTGITIHPEVQSGSTWLQLNSNGLEIFELGQTNTSVAKFGTDGARIGSTDASNVVTDVNGISIRDGLDELATFGADGATIGKSDDSHITITSDSEDIYANDGTTRLASFGSHAVNGKTRIKQVLPFNESSTAYTVSYTIDTSESVTATASNGQTLTVTASEKRIRLSAIPSGTITYIAFEYSTQEDIYDFVLGSSNSTFHANNAVSENNGQAYGINSHAENNSIACGVNSHAQGNGTIALGDCQCVIGQYNDPSFYLKAQGGTFGYLAHLLVIGNGASDSARSNALTVDWSGNLEIAGSLKTNRTLLQVTQTLTLNAVAAGSLTFGSLTLQPNTTYLLLSNITTNSGSSMTLLNDFAFNSTDNLSVNYGAYSRVTTSSGHGLNNWRVVRTNNNSVTATLKGYNYAGTSTSYTQTGRFVAIPL